MCRVRRRAGRATLAREGLPAVAVAVERPAIAGLVTQRSPLGDRYSVRWVLLVEPRGDGEAYLHAFRTGGVLAFSVAVRWTVRARRSR